MGAENVMAVKEEKQGDAKSNVHQIMGVTSLLGIWLHDLTQIFYFFLESVAES
jgi:hypothetical protein